MLGSKIENLVTRRSYKKADGEVRAFGPQRVFQMSHVGHDLTARLYLQPSGNRVPKIDAKSGQGAEGRGNRERPRTLVPVFTVRNVLYVLKKKLMVGLAMLRLGKIDRLARSAEHPLQHRFKGF